jgi:GNAT superfamily N-acetyltransferase
MKHLQLFEDFKVDDLSTKVTNLMNSLEEIYPVDLFLYYSKNSDVIILSKIVIEKKKRSDGVGTKVMNTICDFADENNLRIALTPSSDFGGSKIRLVGFYRNFGFKNYKGYEFRESMCRMPVIKKK